MSGRKTFDRNSKVGRALGSLVAVAQKASVDTRQRVARIANLIENDEGDVMLSHKVESDLSVLMRDPKLNAPVVALRKALRAEAR